MTQATVYREAVRSQEDYYYTTGARVASDKAGTLTVGQQAQIGS